LKYSSTLLKYLLTAEVIPGTQEVEVGESRQEASLGKTCETLSGKITKTKMAGGTFQVVEHLP
jgi:hypothetical protein